MPPSVPPVTRIAYGVNRAVARVQPLVPVRLSNLATTLTLLVGGLVVLVSAWVTAEVYDEVEDGAGVASFDLPVLREAIAWRTPGRDAWMTHLTDLGGTVGLPILLVLAIGLLAWTRRSWTPVVLAVVAYAGALPLTVIGKLAVGRARPDDSLAVPPYESSASFPSGHTLNTTVAVGLVLYLVLPRIGPRWARAAAVLAGALWALLVGLSRVFLGHHWLTDVLAGWAIGLGWIAVVVVAHRVWLTSRAPAPTGERRAPTSPRSG